MANEVNGTVALCASFGRGLDGAEQDRHVEILAGLGRNPNVAAALVVSFEPESARRIAGRVAATGTPVECLSVQEAGGTVKLMETGMRIAGDMVAAATGFPRTPTPLSKLVLGVKCGGSDTTSGLAANPTTGRVADRVVDAGGTVILSETIDIIGAEHELAARAASPDVAEHLLSIVRRMDEEARALGAEISNLYPDHVAAGLTTPEEKSLGSILKGGTTALRQVLEYGEPPREKGLVFMDALGGGIAEITGIAAGGAQIIVFTTGTGHPTGNPVAPTLKVSANPRTVMCNRDNIDVDLSDVILRRCSMDEATDRLMAGILEVCDGRSTQSEVLGDVEIAISPVSAAAQHFVSGRDL